MERGIEIKNKNKNNVPGGISVSRHVSIFFLPELFHIIRDGFRWFLQGQKGARAAKPDKDKRR